MNPIDKQEELLTVLRRAFKISDDTEISRIDAELLGLQIELIEELANEDD
jgi:hypothetical protein